MFRNENRGFKDIRHPMTPGMAFGQDPSWTPTPYFILPPLSSSTDEQATCFVFQSFVLEDTCASRGHFDYLPTGTRQSTNFSRMPSLLLGWPALSTKRRFRRSWSRLISIYGGSPRRRCCFGADGESQGRSDIDICYVVKLVRGMWALLLV
jgi:hypothetical protein